MLIEASAALWGNKNPAADCFCSSTAGLVCVMCVSEHYSSCAASCAICSWLKPVYFIIMS